MTQVIEEMIFMKADMIRHVGNIVTTVLINYTLKLNTKNYIIFYFFDVTSNFEIPFALAKIVCLDQRYSQYFR